MSGQVRRLRAAFLLSAALAAALAVGGCPLDDPGPNAISTTLDQVLPVASGCERAARVAAVVDLLDRQTGANGSLGAAVAYPAGLLAGGYRSGGLDKAGAYALQLQIALAAEPAVTAWLVRIRVATEGITEAKATLAMRSRAALDKLDDAVRLALSARANYDAARAAIAAAGC